MNLYSRLKAIVKAMFPKQLLFKYEHLFRNIYYLRYIGKQHKCNICNAELRAFVGIKSDRLCPKCGSLERTRRLWEIVRDSFLNDSPAVLDFSPSRNMYRKMKKTVKNYVTTDLSGDFISDHSYNIKNIDCNNETFDLILCYHVLEHIDEDEKAMSELYRVLKMCGHCVIQTPFKEGNIYENSAITSAEDRELHFGQSDHVRIYSVAGLKDRLQRTGFEVEVRHFREEEANYHGFAANETVLICKKTQ